MNQERYHIPLIQSRYAEGGQVRIHDAVQNVKVGMAPAALSVGDAR